MGTGTRTYNNGKDFKDNGTEIQLNLKITFNSFKEEEAILDKKSSTEIEKIILDSRDILKDILKEYIYRKITGSLTIDTDYMEMWLGDGNIEIEEIE